MGQGALQDESNVRNTLRANVAEKLADIWLAAHLCEKKQMTFTGMNKIKRAVCIRHIFHRVKPG